MSYTREETADAVVNMILEIPPSDEDLRKIIEAAEDIACQTNLLAVRLASKQVSSGNLLPDMR
jgi:methyl-accepting chemotaxis protein